MSRPVSTAFRSRLVTTTRRFVQRQKVGEGATASPSVVAEVPLDRGHRWVDGGQCVSHQDELHVAILRHGWNCSPRKYIA